MEPKIKEMSAQVIKELLGTLPYAGFVIPFIELLENLVQQDQLEATLNWLVENKEYSLNIPKNSPHPGDVHAWVQEQFESASPDKSSYAFGYSHSVVIGKKLILFQTNKSSEHLLPKERSVIGEFYPKVQTKTLFLKIADDWEWEESQESMPAEGTTPILLPTRQANVIDIALTEQNLSALLSRFHRYEAAETTYQGRQTDISRNPIRDWTTVINLLTENIPEITNLFPNQ